MKKSLTLMALVVFWAGLALAQREAAEVTLTGIVTLPGMRRAFLVANPDGRDRADLDLAEGQSRDGVEVMEIKSRAGVVKVGLEMGFKNLALHPNAETNAPLIAPTNRVPSIQFANADINLAFRLYGELAHRTILHPAFVKRTVSMDVFAKTADEAVRALEWAFKQDGLVVIPDGDKFVMIVPKERAAMAVPQSAKLKSRPPQPLTLYSGNALKGEGHVPDMNAGEINFPSVDLESAVLVYSVMMGRDIDHRHKFPTGHANISLLTQTPLTKTEALYALETLFGWEGIKVVPKGRKLLEVMPLAAK
jgi:hypothetical protein